MISYDLDIRNGAASELPEWAGKQPVRYWEGERRYPTSANAAAFSRKDRLLESAPHAFVAYACLISGSLHSTSFAVREREN